MPRQKFEFSCTNCQKYFDFNLNTTLNGNYRIHCPNCGHIHYRQVNNGAITDNRFTDGHDDQILVEDIVPMVSSCRDYQKETAEDNSLNARGFVKRLWSELFSGVTS